MATAKNNAPDKGKDAKEKRTNIDVAPKGNIYITYRDKVFSCTSEYLHLYSTVWKEALEYDPKTKEFHLDNDRYLSDELWDVLKWIHCPEYVAGRNDLLKPTLYTAYYYIAHKYGISRLLEYSQQLALNDRDGNQTQRWVNHMFMLDSLQLTETAFARKDAIPAINRLGALISQGGAFITQLEKLRDATKNMLLKHYMTQN